MSNHSVAETKNKLSELIDRALSGEEIVVTRHGQPVVALSPRGQTSQAMTEADWDWLARRRKGRGRPKENAGLSVSRMRDEDWR